MVGVPGKYKGCNTCRVRRVKCDNTRPFCKKCIDYGRECGGYERETVFIVGTQNDKGRVGSHPPRNAQQTRTSQPKMSSQNASKLQFEVAEPLQPAWQETVLLKSGAGSHRVRIVAQHTDLESAVRHRGSPPQSNEALLSLLDSQPLDVTPTFREENFNLKALCFVALDEAGDEIPTDSDDGVCLFLYQQNSSTMYTQEGPWNGMSAASDAVRELGPAAYQHFPAHHFFARVYRPSAIWAALLNRQPTFLCNPEWTVVPWENYPRTSLDDLLDIVVLLPSIFSRADQILPLSATADRQSRAMELLTNCMNIEAQFDIWLSVVQQRNRSSYWVVEHTESASHLPFGEPLGFGNHLLCLVHIYYWTVLICFHQCVYALLKAIREPQNGLELPPGLDPRKYQPAETRRLAALVCRSMDFALRTTAQPDLLVAPVWIIRDFYDHMQATGLCELEGLWINDFIERREIRGREMSVWLEEKRWIGVSRFG